MQQAAEDQTEPVNVALKWIANVTSNESAVIALGPSQAFHISDDRARLGILAIGSVRRKVPKFKPTHYPRSA